MKQNILVVDDDIDCCEAMVDFLVISGFQVVGATSAKDALNKMSELVVAALIDYQLDNSMNGIELGLMLYQKYQVKVAIMSGLVRQCPSEFRFFRKPPEVEELVEYFQESLK